MSNQELSWNPEIPNQRVRLKNSGREGTTTGKIKNRPQGLIVEIRFGPNEVTRKKYTDLELCPEEETITDLFQKGIYGKPSDLRQILTFEKVKGHLTNVFYSMEASNTDFYAYQFKPVMKFLDSPVGRLLIADEVGLGKTIESMYIWKEIQAREDARRLLIVCPSMLRDKWVNDLKNQFNIYAEVLKGKELFNKLDSFSKTGKPNSFVYVASLEGIRPPKNSEDQEVKGARADLARLFDQYQNQESKLFDLVIFDEAHYLRNPETGNNKLGRILRDAAEHLVLLTATPIQIRSDNLYQLLRLISPEDFYDPSIFQQMLDANKPIIKALSLVWTVSTGTPEKMSEVKEALRKALEFDYFKDSLRLKQIQNELEELQDNCSLTSNKQFQYAQTLESSSLFGQYMTRSRKRDVMKRVIRSPQVLEVKFSPVEKQIYQRVTQTIRQKAKGKKGVAVFSLIMRQRQMASCMVAALASWKQQNKLNEFLTLDQTEVETDDHDELSWELWEDLGIIYENGNYKQIKQELSSLDQELLDSFSQEINLEELKQKDTKYQKLLQTLKYNLKDNPQEKFVLFAYFKPTLHYLQERLKEDGIKTCLIQGGMKRETKQDVLNEFKDNSKISVLLSSEVGSEGIDLQFCRVIINYDLPWNPMRVEQRIGRLDRIGQKADNISIINFTLVDTIEERILSRLYDRIGIFQESIGDIEEILGEMTEKLLIDLLNPDLSEEDQEKLEQQTELALTNKIEQQRKLENEAINSVAFSDYIFDAVKKSRNQGRWLQPKQLEQFVNDYFQLQYPGTVIKPKPEQAHVSDITLSEEAKTDLKVFCQKNKLPVQTLLHVPNRTVTCFFDPKIVNTVGKPSWELIDPTHPLIKWIAHQYESEAQKVNQIASIKLKYQDVQHEIDNENLSYGIYLYIVQLWTFEGLRQENKLAHKVINLERRNLLSNEIGEKLVHIASVKGEQKPNANNLVNDFQEILSTYEECDDLLKDQFLEDSESFEAENEDWCNLQEGIAKRSSQRKIEEIEERIARFMQEGKTRIIPAEQGKIAKENQNLQVKLAKIQEKRQTKTSNPTLAAGLIFIEEN